jgi:hypothetical protein
VAGHRHDGAQVSEFHAQHPAGTDRKVKDDFVTGPIT